MCAFGSLSQSIIITDLLVTMLMELLHAQVDMDTDTDEVSKYMVKTETKTKQE